MSVDELFCALILMLSGMKNSRKLHLIIIDNCFTLQNYALFLIFRCIISFFFNNFAPRKQLSVKNLAIDIGNTCAKLVAFEGDEPIEEWRVDEGEWGKVKEFCHRHHFCRGIYSTVVRLTAEMKEAIEGIAFPMTQFIPGVTPVPIANDYDDPTKVGADRLAAAVGAWTKAGGREVLVIDVGTCVTYDFVTADGHYRGGNISPGPTIRLKSLHHFTDALPLLSRKGETPELGHNTETAIRAGVMRGLVYEIEGYVREYLLKYPQLFIYLTGGVDIDLHISEKKRIFADRFIVPEGLNRVLNYQVEIK